MLLWTLSWPHFLALTFHRVSFGHAKRGEEWRVSGLLAPVPVIFDGAAQVFLVMSEPVGQVKSLKYTAPNRNASTMLIESRPSSHVVVGYKQWPTNSVRTHRRGKGEDSGKGKMTGYFIELSRVRPVPTLWIIF